MDNQNPNENNPNAAPQPAPAPPAPAPQPNPPMTPTSVQPPQPAPTPIQLQPTIASPQPQPVRQPQTAPLPPKEKKASSGIVSFFVTIAAALILTQVINLFLFQSYRVLGSSMEPTMQDGDRLIISKVGKTTSKVTNNDFQPERSEVIVFISPKDPSLQLIKRVIGLPGERVVLKDGVFTVYNDEFPQGFNPDDAEYGENLPETTGQVDIRVPKNHVFVSGDNRSGSNSLDSRNELGTIPEENIVGTTSLRLWPIQTARFF